MKLKSVWFDLDGTLLPMDLQVLLDAYFSSLSRTLSSEGYEPKELIRNIWQATRSMMRNDGSRTNEQVFWEAMNALYPEKTPLDPAPFERFYQEQYDALSSVCGFQPDASSLIASLKEEGFALILATNPVFPRIAIETRMRWAGVSPDSFDLITTYENSASCKPSQDYYRSVLENSGCAPENCVMIGNDVEEDLPAEQIGVKTFLVTDCLINRYGTSPDLFSHGSFSEILPWIQNHFRGKDGD